MQLSAANILSTGKWTKVTAWTLAVVLLLMFVIGFWASREPKVFWVQRSADQESAIVGYSTVDTLIRVAETLLEKNAGYLTNDKLPPFVFLDNIPSWELGVVNQIATSAVSCEMTIRAASRSPRKTWMLPRARRCFSTTTTPGFFQRPSLSIGKASRHLPGTERALSRAIRIPFSMRALIIFANGSRKLRSVLAA